jgi:riboflavin kinase/FMN adenylyltransferase
MRGFVNPLLFIRLDEFHPRKIMGIKEELTKFSPDEDMVLAIGVFDGVHLGHKRLILKVKERARNLGLLSGVVTFRQHPQEVLSPGLEVLYLTSLRERVSLLQNEDVGAVIALSFTRELSQLSADEFAGLLKKYLRLKELVVGLDFVLGRNKEGNIEYLRTLGKDMGFSITTVPLEMINGEVVSSTAIRNTLTKGGMEKVRSLTGRYFSLTGRVITGSGRGLELGFPTANLEVARQQILPPDGVYASLVYIGDKTYQSMTNIGMDITFGSNERTIEVYIIDYSANLYGDELRIDFVERLRDELQFDTVEGLKKQIAEDIKKGRAILSLRRIN